MKGMTIAGVVLLVLGGLVLFFGGSFTSKRDVLKIGDLKVSASEERTIPPWLGGVVMLAGAGLLVAGARKRA